MKIGNVNIEGFMAIGSAVLGLADRGLVLIQGINKDDASAQSNGSGKSTIPDAISWCLYGVTARGESGDDIINNNRKSASVVVDLIDDDECVYRVSRYRKDKKHKNHVILEKQTPSGGTAINLTLSSDKETQVRIDQIVGCDVDVFNAAIYQGQEQIPDMPNMTDKQIKNLIEQAAGISVLEDCYKIALFEKNEAEKLVDGLDREYDTARLAVEQAESDKTEVVIKMAEWDSDKKVKKTTAEELEQSAYKLKKASDEKLARAEEKVPTINANIAKHKTVLEEKNGCDSVLRDLRGSQHEQETNLKLADSAVTRITNNIKANQDRLEDVKTRIGTDCTECGKPIEEADLASVKSGIEMVIVKKEEELKVEEITAAGEVITLEVCVKRADDYEEAMPDYTETSDRLNKCNLVLAKIETLRVQCKGYESAWDSAAAWTAEVDVSVNPHTAHHTGVIEKLKLATEDRADLQKKLGKQIDTLLLAKSVMEVYAPAGVRAHILDHVTPFLNSRTAHYLSALSDGNLSAEWSTGSFTKKGDMREKFSIKVSNMTGGRKFGLLSGGEKRKVRLSCAMALQDVVSGRATKPIELFMADEIDDALDDAGLERLMVLLEEKARERGTVLVISHRSLSDWIREVAVVTKEGGEATISGALNV